MPRFRPYDAAAYSRGFELGDYCRVCGHLYLDHTDERCPSPDDKIIVKEKTT